LPVEHFILKQPQRVSRETALRNVPVLSLSLDPSGPTL
jgi:hypothetical protein